MMASYAFRCDTCGAELTADLPMDECTNVARHPQCCGVAARRDYTPRAAPRIAPLNSLYANGFVDPDIARDGKPRLITSRAQHEELMRIHGVRPHEQSSEERYRLKHVKDRADYSRPER